MPKRKVIIVGAGVGGIATAARLARAGYSVTVLEKNELPGGRVGRMDLEGYRFDTGPTIFLMPEVYARAYADLGERMEDHLALRRIDPTYRLHFNDGTRMRLTSDLAAMREQLEALEPGSFLRMMRYLEEGGAHYDLSVPNLVDRDFNGFFDFFTPANLLLFARLKAHLPHAGYAGGFFRDARLRIAFTFHDMYMGLSPYESPASYSLLQYSELGKGMWLPEGGMYRIVESLAQIAGRAGVEFRYDTPVEKIVTRDGRAAGVALSDGGFLPADLVVANADLGYVYRRLLPDEADAGSVDRKEHGCSTIMFYWGLNGRVPELGSHNLFFSGDYRDNFTALKDGRTVSATPNFYIHIPARADESLAPAGCDSMVVAVPAGHLDPQGRQDWPALQARVRSFVMARLSQAGVPALDSKIRVEAGCTPVDWQSRYNLTRGSTHGLSHKLTQMAYFRPAHRHARYRNLYFVGASTHPGTGIPMVLISSRLVAEHIRREWPENR